MACCGRSCEFVQANLCDLPRRSHMYLRVGSHPHLWCVQDPTQHTDKPCLSRIVRIALSASTVVIAGERYEMQVL